MHILAFSFVSVLRIPFSLSDAIPNASFLRDLTNDQFFIFIISPYTKMSRCVQGDFVLHLHKVSKGAKIRNRYNQVHVPHLTQDTNGNVINEQLDTLNESQEVSPFPTGESLKAKFY